MIDDYMLTYANYYNITEESDSARFETIKEKNAYMMLRMIIGDQDSEKTYPKLLTTLPMQEAS